MVHNNNKDFMQTYIGCLSFFAKICHIPQFHKNTAG